MTDITDDYRTKPVLLYKQHTINKDMGPMGLFRIVDELALRRALYLTEVKPEGLLTYSKTMQDYKEFIWKHKDELRSELEKMIKESQPS